MEKILLAIEWFKPDQCDHVILQLNKPSGIFHFPPWTMQTGDLPMSWQRAKESTRIVKIRNFPFKNPRFLESFEKKSEVLAFYGPYFHMAPAAGNEYQLSTNFQEQ